MSVLAGDDESFDHLGSDEVPVKLIKFCQPEVVAIKVQTWFRRLIWIAAQVTKVLHQDKRSVGFLLGKRRILRYPTQHPRTRRHVNRITSPAKLIDGRRGLGRRGSNTCLEKESCHELFRCHRRGVGRNKSWPHDEGSGQRLAC